MERIRAFIAIELPEEVKASLDRIQAQLKSGQDYVKWVQPEGIHLTLKFLGNIAVSLVPSIGDAITQAAKSVTAFNLEIARLGAFPNLSAPRVAWVGLGGNVGCLLQLQKAIDQELVPLGFDPEARAFSPHLTLGRVRDKAAPQERRKLGQRLESLQVQGGQPFSVDEVSLMRSELTPRGAIYSRLSSVKLLLPKVDT